MALSFSLWKLSCFNNSSVIDNNEQRRRTMKGTENKTISQAGQLMLESLRQSVAEALEKKRRLGQYAVIWQNGKPVLVGEDAPVQER